MPLACTHREFPQSKTANHRQERQRMMAEPRVPIVGNYDSELPLS